MTDSAGLTGDTAAVSDNQDVVFACSLSKSKRLFNDQLQCFQTEVIIQIAFVDNDSSFTRHETYTCYRVFTTTGSIVLNLCHETVLPLINREVRKLLDFVLDAGVPILRIL